MALPDLDPPFLVQDQAGLERLLEDLARQSRIAVDTEADSFYCYREKVCLIQVTAEDRDYLVDPLCGLDLDGFGRVLADPKRTKVFHDAEYDVLLLKRTLGWKFANLFDTRVAAAALGMEAPGLASVLADRFGVELDKSMQRSDWARRPLSEKQITYARLDTHFLLPLMRELEAELAERGREMIVAGECRRLEQIEPPRVEFDADEFVKVKGARNLTPLGRQALRELFALREKLAEKWDTPPFRVMNNPLLLELAEARPRGMRKLGEVKGFSQRMLRKLGGEVLEALARARELGPLDKLPVLRRRDGTGELSEVETDLYERLKQLRKSVADEHGIESSYLLNRHVMLRIAKERPRTSKRLARVDGLLDWQMDMYGERLLVLVRAFEADVESGAVPKRRSWRRGR